MANSREIISYKQQIMSDIIHTDTIVAALDYDYNGNVENLIYNRVFPFHRVPSTIEEVGTYITMSIDIISPSSKNNLVVDVELTLCVMCHQNDMKTNMGATRIDYIGAELDSLFNQNKKMGNIPLELVSNDEGAIDYTHRCRTLRFRTQDINNAGCNR